MRDKQELNSISDQIDALYRKEFEPVYNKKHPYNLVWQEGYDHAIANIVPQLKVLLEWLAEGSVEFDEKTYEALKDLIKELKETDETSKG